MVSFSEKDMSYQLFTHIKQFIYYIRIFFMLFLLACFSSHNPNVQTTPENTPGQKTVPTPAKNSKTKISVFFWNTEKEKLIPVQRLVENKDLAQQSLKHLYKGPKATESSLTLIHCQSSDAQIQSIQNGLIRVQLLGECGSCGSMSIYDSIVATLKQFPFIETVHVLDPQGNTQSDGDNIDARPACLNP